jgi:hypothetical protein
MELLVEILPYDIISYHTLMKGEYISSTTHNKGSDLAIFNGIISDSRWTPGLFSTAVVTIGAILFGIWALHMCI